MMKKIGLSALALVLTACTSSNDRAAGDSATTNVTASTMSLTAADLDGFEKGLSREIQVVKEGQERARRATTAVERGNAIQSTFEENTMAQGVEASGLPLERYRLVRQTLSRLLTTLDLQGKIDGPQSADTARADADLKARLASDPYVALDPASADLLKGRLDRIVPKWVEYVNLTIVGG